MPAAAIVAIHAGTLCSVDAADHHRDAAEMVLIAAASFEMGSPLDEPGRFQWEKPHTVSLTRPFYLGRTEVSWSTWNRVRDWALRHGYETLSAGNNGFRGEDAEDHPVIAVSWWDAVHWCNARSEMESLVPVYYQHRTFRRNEVLRVARSTVHANWQANGYRLPTEAEWEYAYRAGDAPIVLGGEPASLARIDQLGWYAGNSATNTHPVAAKPANAFGLHDMAGNVWEWCWDWDGPYPNTAVQDPRGPASGNLKSMRGGSWTSPAGNLRSAHRHAHPPFQRFYNIGFRLARTE